MSAGRERLLRVATAHVMWPERADEDVKCSCGTLIEAVCWHDDVVRTDIKIQHPGVAEYVISYPRDGFDTSAVGVQLVTGGRARNVSSRNLAWLLAQPDLPEEFRRAAAVHLPPG